MTPPPIAKRQDISIALTGSGGAGVVAAGELLLRLAAQSGYYGLMRKAYGPQIRGGESAALLRLGNHPINCMDDRFKLLLALDWHNTERFAAEIPLDDNSLIIADPQAGDIPGIISNYGAAVESIELTTMASETPGGRSNMVALGLLAGWLGFDAGNARQWIADAFSDKGDEIVATSIACFERGFVTGIKGLGAPDIIPTDSAIPRWQLSGNEACGLGVLRGGVRFAAAYPITPASDMLEWLAPRLEKLGGSLLQAEDELASINMIIGASYGGVPAMTATSGPGLALMLEGFGLAIASETPIVIINVMRGGPSTGIPTKSEQTDLNIALYGMHGDAPHLVLAALDTADCIFTSQWAVQLAEALQASAIVLSDQSLAQSRALIPAPETPEPTVPKRKHQLTTDEPYLRYAITEDGVSPMAIPGDARSMYTADGLEHSPSGKPSSAAADHSAQSDKRQRKLQQFDYGEYWAETAGEGDTAIICWGSSTGAAREAQQRLQQAGSPVRLIAMRLLLPACTTQMDEQLRGVERVLVVEQSHSKQFHHYLRAYFDIDAQLDCLAKPGPLSISPGEIVERISNWRQNP
jgi:2-oxoglutarate ferredoxin oxidoreductase subunit alpha